MSAEIDRLERDLADTLEEIPSGGGDVDIHGARAPAAKASSIIRAMIEQIVREQGETA